VTRHADAIVARATTVSVLDRVAGAGVYSIQRWNPPGVWEGRAVKLSGRALRLSIFIGEGDSWHHKSLYTEIVHRAHKAGLAGATVIRGIEGFGASSRIHTTHVFRLSGDLPLLVVIVDAEDRVREFLPRLDELEISGLVILDEVNVVRYVADERKRRGLRRAR
jgi:PII-like signaling protein